MKTKKVSLIGIKEKMNRVEMKTIMAGCGTGSCSYWMGFCGSYNNFRCDSKGACCY